MKNTNIILPTIIIFAGISRIFLIIFFHADAGDTPTYELFAENILRGCGLSFSPPGSNICNLTSGGYFPGYPGFIAINWYLFGKSYYPILISQLCLFLMALYWFLNALLLLTKNNKAVIYIGMLLALSPLQIGWFRYTITEPLAISASMWFLAEIMISITEKKLRKYHIAFILSASVYIRPDTILMSVGILVVSFYLYNFKNAIIQIFIIFILTSISVSAWMIRNYMLGHAPLNMTSEAAPKTTGYLLWLDTWIVNEYERADANFPVWNKEYTKINIHESKYISTEEMEKINILINSMYLLDGKEITKHIDRQFHEITILKLNNRSIIEKTEIYIKRVLWLLLNPFSSWGLPLEIKKIDKSIIVHNINNFDWNAISTQSSQYIGILSAKGFIFIYRVLLFTCFVALALAYMTKFKIHQINEWTIEIKIITLTTILISFSRILFFVIIGALESRYLVEIITWIECCTMLLLLNFCKQEKNKISP